VDQVVAVAVAIIVAVVFTLGAWLARGLTGTLAARLTLERRWLTLPLTSVLSFGLFLVLRPFLLDQPRTPLWLVLGVLAVGALFTGSVTLAQTVIAASRLALSPSGSTRWGLLVGVATVVLVGLLLGAGLVFAVVSHKPGG
jgi:hypothetical protein